MYIENMIKKEKFELILNAALGLGLLAAGISMRALDINLLKNNKSIIALSFIPLAMAFSKYISIYFIKKHPDKMNLAIISENDERLVKERNEAEAKSNKVFRWLIYLVFLGYTFMVPNDAFEAAGWWVVLAIFLMAYLIPCIFLKRIQNKDYGCR